MRYETQERDEGLKIRDVLKRRLDFSTRLIRKLKEEGGVFLDGEERWLNVPVRKGQLIEVRFPEEKSWFEPQEIPLDIRWEDEDLLILTKPPGIVVHPTKGHPSGTIANGLAYYMMQKGENWKIRFVNRLDMDTSGLLIVSKNAFSQEHLQQQMKSGTIVKKYLAVVEGILEEEEGVID
ncbi:MAG: RluA family pseudouridine synthase, partial [Firmicutes bacterium]|nr:RluA family pseudouridine synthase [Bacillota bacterium]